MVKQIAIVNKQSMLLELKVIIKGIFHSQRFKLKNKF